MKWRSSIQPCVIQGLIKRKCSFSGHESAKRFGAGFKATLTASSLTRIETESESQDTVRLSTAVCCKLMKMNWPLMGALLWCKWSMCLVTHINVSNLLTEQDVKSAGSYCTRGGRDTRGRGRGVLTWTAFCSPFTIKWSAGWGEKTGHRSKNLFSQQSICSSKAK